MALLRGKLVTRYTLRIQGDKVTAAAMGSGRSGGHYTVKAVTRNDGDVTAVMDDLFEGVLEPTKSATR